MPTNRHVSHATVDTYADVLIQAANNEGGREAVVEVRNQLRDIMNVVNINIKLSTALDDDTMTVEQREQIAQGVFKDAHPALANTIKVMASRCEFHLLNRVRATYEELIEEKMNFSVVDVTTVVELDDHLRKVITEKAESDLGRECVLVEHIDPSIKGGIVMSNRGRYVDASLTSRLRKANIVLKKKTIGGER